MAIVKKAGALADNTDKEKKWNFILAVTHREN